MMSLQALLEQYFDSGSLVIPYNTTLDSVDDDLDQIFIETCLNRWQEEIPDGTPNGDTKAFTWAARCFAVYAQLLVNRQYGPDIVEWAAEQLAQNTPDNQDPSAIIGVDCIFRSLPILIEHIARLDDTDPLLKAILPVATAWPLSSVGITLRESPPDNLINIILTHPSLRICYIDRIISKQDHTRLQHSATAMAVQDSLGLHGAELAPHLMSILETTQND